MDFRTASDLGGFESFVFARADRILRVTHHSHRMPDQIAAELEFINYLADRGGAVCKPVPLADGELLKSYDDFSACQFQRAPGGVIGAADWGPELFKTWGGCIGRFHRIAAGFEAEHLRTDWRRDENHHFSKRLPPEHQEIAERGAQLLGGFENLPVTKANYGLIHGDAHPGNFFIDDKSLAFFDFDDAIYMWFAYDVATILFGAVLAREVDNTRLAQEAQARYFLPHFLEGYATEASTGELMLAEFPRFLKLRELSLYAVIHAHLDVHNLDDWYPAKFMLDRTHRLVRDEPFLDLDFRMFS